MDAGDGQTSHSFPGQAAAMIVRDGVQFDDRDATLLWTIDDEGSVNRATETLGRSHARALGRIETLEEAFGPLVTRTRGGSGGGGSEVTERGRSLLDRFARLDAAVEATAAAEETVLTGTVTDVTGELADVETEIGSVRGIHGGVRPGSTVQVRIASDALTVHMPDDVDPDRTSARNRIRAAVSAIDSGETVHTLELDVDPVIVRAVVTTESLERMSIEAGTTVELNWKATATRLIERG